MKAIKLFSFVKQSLLGVFCVPCCSVEIPLCEEWSVASHIYVNIIFGSGGETRLKEDYTGVGNKEC